MTSNSYITFRQCKLWVCASYRQYKCKLHYFMGRATKHHGGRNSETTLEYKLKTQFVVSMTNKHPKLLVTTLTAKMKASRIAAISVDHWTIRAPYSSLNQKWSWILLKDFSHTIAYHQRGRIEHSHLWSPDECVSRAVQPDNLGETLTLRQWDLRWFSPIHATPDRCIQRWNLPHEKTVTFLC